MFASSEHFNASHRRSAVSVSVLVCLSVCVVSVDDSSLSVCLSVYVSVCVSRYQC